MTRTKTAKQELASRPRGFTRAGSKPAKFIDPTQRKPRAKKGSTLPEDGYKRVGGLKTHHEKKHHGEPYALPAPEPLHDWKEVSVRSNEETDCMRFDESDHEDVALGEGGHPSQEVFEPPSSGTDAETSTRNATPLTVEASSRGPSTPPSHIACAKSFPSESCTSHDSHSTT
ncbi:hypothetical protein SISNIDRAFT_546165 [Sistotremastrum niveocremeum HHB9708]|uniref:Uncharacterized protein n=1 Tax=Sistotremastrum niveocremeum HHB9708 TaxID=1314777 RepID=A0A164ZW87_9AGAM|nr:hypothetical protein SISNIDRAFT_546165 [Sistotremastrum niveocremeum HHB9708]